MARRPRKKQDDIEQQKNGGIAFFLSLFFLLLLSIIFLVVLPALWDAEARHHIFRFGMGAALGVFVAAYFIKGHLSVVFHELKHDIVSMLVGNKRKGWSIKHDSGYYRYAYSKDTEEYNAFIQLAPYWIPLFTIASTVVALPFFYNDRALMVVLVGVGWGMDNVMNIRDISPIQTDITLIRGGYKIGVLYIIAINFVLSSIVFAWVFKGGTGLALLGRGLWEFCVYMVSYYRSR